MNTDTEKYGTNNRPTADENQAIRPPSQVLEGPGILRQALLLVVAILLAAGLLAAGAYWHENIGGWFGRGDGQDHSADATAAGRKQLWTCGMHPQVIQDKPGICPICHM